MGSILAKISRGVTDSVGTFFGVLKRVDYETLSHYILNINQVHDLDGITHEMAKCLHEIFNYRMFAFALQSDDGLHVWTDAAMQEEMIKDLVKNDFVGSGRMCLHHLNGKPGTSNLRGLDRASIVSTVLADERYHAKLYIAPDRRMFRYHADIIAILARTLDIAVSNYMRVKHLQDEAAFDPLTDCYNRREFDRLIEHSMANSRRYGHDLSVLFCDIDHFKKVNDTHGHQVGDIVLKEISSSILSAIRKGDYIARYGGEEFVVVLPHTKITRAIELAERLRKLVEELEIKVSDELTVKVTVSFGVAALKESSDKLSLLKEADHMLYMAKRNGRNMVMPQLKLHVFGNG